ncbi:uncharacterized protein Dwil_GK14765, isoform B [Drosophila willistoni]|uniref:Uncharacterized protein, isoform B n=1 Tax=Drosophila willistoni TaxID=7260 RepID=A0A0Q9X2F8_DROWI|nr:uncharacterized protein Dwil_GK14765, isoform B [Drosophila willistoni]
MEHLDLAGYLNNTAATTWNSFGAFDQQDAAIYLSSSRQMLEPILEETSEDEEHAQNSWHGQQENSNGHNGGFWSSTESETGSVIRIEVTKDIDAISERDFVCPPKRARRCPDQLDQQQQPHSLDDVVQLRRCRYDPESHNSLERFLALEASARDSYGSQGQRSSAGSRRGFEDYYSDNDSYHSLSRSSSLVQFESLERQLTLQEQHQSMNSLGNSSPSLINCDLSAGGGTSDTSNPESRRGSASSLSLMKRYESSDGRLHQTYFELNKLNFEADQRDLFSKSLHLQAEIKSDSESSSSSSDSSSGHSLLSQGGTGGAVVAASRRLPLNSAENLSEDSGYCEPSTLRREKSKSIPKNFDKLCEAEEEEELQLEESKNSNNGGHDLCQTKIENSSGNSIATTPTKMATEKSSVPCSPTSSINSSTTSERANGSQHSPSPSPSAASSSSAASFTWLGNSLPDIREPRGSPSSPSSTDYGYVLATKRNTASKSGRSSSPSASSSSAESSPVLGAISLPNELPDLGRRRRPRQRRNCQSHSSGHSSSEEADLEEEERRDDFFLDCPSLYRIRRSSSWTERGGRGGAARGLGYLNASYQNLTLLDYSDQATPDTENIVNNSKRSQNSTMAEQKRCSKDDYEQIICKGNFLLDELSQIYDKNASILNDKPVVEMEEQKPVVNQIVEDQVDSAPIMEPPPQVQHVQLTIRKPPARQKRSVDDPNPHLSTEPSQSNPQLPPAAVISFSSFGKTFDQDPTNLRTSYAQSLEKCNFEPLEVTIKSPPVRSLPKRRFHSQAAAAKQKNLVSSTPNLSSYDNANADTEDDMFVSSAHTSMHQLPQTPTQPKPLGILLPAGSRNSFSKEVSFCPVVSKYCWQEQSSEEPQEEQADSDEEDDEADDDDVLEQTDATVIHNTKENEYVAARYNQEQEKQREKLREQHHEESSPAIVGEENMEQSESDDNNENIQAATLAERQNVVTPVEPPQTVPSIEPVSSSAVSLEPSAVAYASPAAVNVASVASNVAPQRPLSLHLPILSEPPTNRAHHILYASQQLLQRYEDNESIDMSPSSATTTATTTPTTIMKESKVQAKGKTDDKHPSSKSFLSRFAHGLRFSLRRKKKQQQQFEPNSKSGSNKSSNSKQGNGKSSDFIHIPLKPPRSHNQSANSSQLDDSNASEASTASMHSSKQQQQPQFNPEPAKTSTLQKVVTGKPPLPKQPPRLTHAQNPNANLSPNPLNAAHMSEALLAAEREQYQAFAAQLQQLQSDRQTSRMRDTESPSRASVAQKTQMFNQLSGGGVAGMARPTMVTAVPVAVSPVIENADGVGKMGLIETNLDTHETVISGKTRSLMDITSNPLTLPHKRYIVKRLNVTSAAYDVDIGDDEDDVDDDDENVDGSNGHRRIKSSSKSAGVQIASVRRPHKSMEFLLDKENQKNVLPPENELQKSHDHNPAALSEHQLRVQASLQRLNIPDWFRAYNQTNATHSPDGATGTGNISTSGTTGGYRPGNFTRKRTQDSGRWQGLNSKTTSLSSLGSQRSDRSPLLLSPSAHSHHGGQSNSVTAASHGHHQHGAHPQGVGATRWSTSHLNSTQTSPSVSQRGSFARGVPINSSFMSVASGSSAGGAPGGVLRNSYRQPYLGWRSTEKLSQRTPHERLANSLLARRTSPTTATANGGVRTTLQPVTPEIQSSIKEVTSAIVHYVNDQQEQQSQQHRSRSASPNSRKCWLESSFVGIRPLDSPQTPVIDNSPPGTTHQHQQEHLHLDATSNLSSIQQPLRMNGLSRIGGGGVYVKIIAPERSLSSASLEDVLASLLGLPTTSSSSQNSNSNNNNNRTQQQAAAATTDLASRQQLEVLTAAEQQRLRRRSEGDAPNQKQKQQQQQQQQQQQNHTQSQSHSHSASASAPINQTNASSGSRRVSLGDSHTDKTNNSFNGDQQQLLQQQQQQQQLLQIKCRNTKCEQSATPADAKKLYKSCHNCTHLYCSRECRRAHWEKHRKACLHSRASNLCRQVLATCKDDVDSQRHLSLLARKGSLSQGRGVVRVLFRSAESAEGFIKHGFQCMGEASYVRWPDLMPAEMGLELYSELLKLSTEYKPESKMLIYVAICVVSEAPGMGQAPVRWERQLVSRCAKLKLCKTVLLELEQQQQALQQQPLSVVAVPERTEILILTFNPGLRSVPGNRELILSNILDILSRRGVLLRKHYPEIYQRLQTYTDGQTDKFNPVTLHPRDSQTGQSFVCIIMPVHTDSEFIKLPSAADGGGNRVTTIDVGSPAALAQLDDDELLTRTTS